MGKPGREVIMKSQPWTKELKEASEYIQNITGQDSEKVMIAKYSQKESGQPWHDDLNNAGGPTQLVDVVLGSQRVLEIKFKETGYTMDIKLKEGHIYIFTHLFNRLFKHKYEHGSYDINYSITFRIK